MGIFYKSDRLCRSDAIIAVSFFYGGIGLMQIAIMTLVVNFRHIFYGLSFLDRFEGMGMKKCIWLLPDR